MDWLRHTWSVGSWVDRAVALGWALLGIGCMTAMPWVATDTRLALANLHTRHTARPDKNLVRGQLDPVPSLLDPWGRPVRAIGRATGIESGFRPYITIHRLVSTGPDGVLDSTYGPSGLLLRGDDIAGAEAPLSSLLRWCPLLGLGVACLAGLSYIAARWLPPIASPSRDLCASALLSLPVCAAGLAIHGLLRTAAPDLSAVTGGSPSLAILTGPTLTILGVRRLHAPLERAPPGSVSEDQPGRAV